MPRSGRCPAKTRSGLRDRAVAAARAGSRQKRNVAARQRAEALLASFLHAFLHARVEDMVPFPARVVCTSLVAGFLRMSGLC